MTELVRISGVLYAQTCFRWEYGIPGASRKWSSDSKQNLGSATQKTQKLRHNYIFTPR